jgi:hypothetical protein
VHGKAITAENFSGNSGAAARIGELTWEQMGRRFDWACSGSLLWLFTKNAPKGRLYKRLWKKCSGRTLLTFTGRLDILQIGHFR